MTRLVIFALAWASGIFLTQAVSFSPVWFLLLVPALAIVHSGWGSEKWAPKLRFALVGLLLGVGRMLLAYPHITPDHVAFYNGVGLGENRVFLEGVIREEPDRRAHLTKLYLDVESITFPNGETRPVHGWVLLKAPPYTAAGYGDRVHAGGMLESPPEFSQFSYREYLARRDVHALLRDADVTVLASHQANRIWEGLLRFKAHAHSVLLSLLPEPQASLLSGILLGIESGIPDDLNAAFVATGTSHIVAISGYNLSIISAFVVRMTKKVVKKRGVVPTALVCVWVYTLFVGASPAVVRAAVMATVALIAREHVSVGRVHGPTSLATAVVFMLAWNPYNLWDAGFQLSVMATLGLILYTEPLTRRFEKFLGHWLDSEKTKFVLSFLSDALIVTLAAQITTTGILVGTFHRLSLVTLITNLLILPAQAYVMAFGIASLLAGLLAPPLGRILAWPAWVFLAWTTQCVQFTAKIPYASVDLGTVALPLVWVGYGGLFALTWWFRQSPDERHRTWDWIKHQDTSRYVAAFGGLVAFLVYLAVRPDGRLHVRFLDVGQGDAILVQTPDNRQILIDGGPDPKRLLSALGRALPFWDRDLDMVILTSPEEERLAGLVPVLERYTVTTVIQGPEVGGGNIFARWQELLRARSPETVGTLWAGMTLPLSDAVILHTLWPDSSSDGPLVLLLNYGETQFLFMGAATTLVEETLAARHGHDLRSTVLLMARHGAQTSTSATFLQVVEPEVAVATTGEDSRYPSPVVLARLTDVPVYLTARAGAVEIITDGQAVQIETERAFMP